MFRKAWHRLFVGVAVFAALGSASFAHSPASRESKPGLDQSPEFADRMRRMVRSESYRLGAGLAERAGYKLTRALLENAGLPVAEQNRVLYSGPMKAFPFEAHPALRSTGSVRVLVLLIDFADHKGTIPRESFERGFFGIDAPSTKTFFPYESLRQYYLRASERKLDIQGSVLGWVNLPKKRAEYEPQYPPNVDELEKNRLDRKALFAIITDALKTAPSDFNFSQFDNNRDGDIDLVHVIYAGPDTGWGGFWWAYQWRFDEALGRTKKVGGKRLGQFIFQFLEERGNGEFDPLTSIHETGHALGLPDFYDYCSVKAFKAKKCPTWVAKPGPDGGLGGLDMMDGNMGNHNALSRWFLDWIAPTVVQPGTQTTFTLSPSGGDTGGVKALAIFPGLKQTNAPGQEMFLIENRKRMGNDAGMANMPSDGLLIWHVDSTPAADKKDLAYDNSFTERLVVRLVRARSSEKYFNDGERASAQEYFGSGLELTPASTPSSEGYDVRRSNVFIKNIKANGDLITLDVGFVADKIVSASEVLVARRVSSAMRAPPAAAIDGVKLEQLEQELSTTSPEALSKLWAAHKDEIESSGALTQQSVVGELILLTWAARDGQAAVSALMAMPDSAFVRAIYPRVMRAWARKQPVSANDWYFAREQAKLRGSQDLIAGEDFAKILFAWRAESSPATAVEAIDSLQRTSEILGAIKGLGEASTTAGLTVNFFESRLQGLTLNSQEALALKDLHVSWQKVLDLKGVEGLGGKENSVLKQIETYALEIK